MAASNFDARVEAAIDAVRGRTVPGAVNIASIVGVAWGVVALLYGLFAGDPMWTWGAVLAALFYVLCLTQGTVAFAFILHGTQARWGRSLKRISEAFVFFMPVVWVLLLLFLVGGLYIYPWNPAHPHPIDLMPHGDAGAWIAKPYWLQPGWFIFRQLAFSAVLFAISFWFVRNSLRPDLMLAKKRLGADAPAWWDRVIGGATNLEEEVERGMSSNYVLVPIMGFAYSFLFSFLAFDLLMSLQPWWYANMFGGWIFMSSVLLGLCVIAMIATGGVDWLGLRSWVTRSQTHDLGRFMLAGTMFWAYTLYAQILPIYYADIPEETDFFLIRMYLPQWSWLAQLVAVLCFVAPFTILLSRGIKKMRWPFFGVALILFVGLFLERSLVVMPAVYFGDEFPYGAFLFINLGVFAGMMGLLTAVVSRVLATVPAVPISDPMLHPHPWDMHVHSLSAGHATEAQ